jgi:TonB family protein
MHRQFFRGDVLTASGHAVGRSSCCVFARFCRVAWLSFAVAAIAGDSAAASEDAIAKGKDGEAPKPGTAIAFDLPAQPLAQALEQYSVLSGLQVVYDGSLTVGRTSTLVKATVTPETALRMLLNGTGLSPRYMATDGFVLIPGAVAPDPPVNSVPPVVAGWYYGRIQSRLEQAFCSGNGIGSGGYRIALAVWIGPTGAVTRSVLLGSTGTPALDTAIDRTVRGLAIGAPPPNGFAQPVTLLVTPELTQDCGAIAEEARQIGAGP